MVPLILWKTAHARNGVPGTTSGCFNFSPEKAVTQLNFWGESSTTRRLCEACRSATCCSLCRSMR